MGKMHGAAFASLVVWASGAAAQDPRSLLLSAVRLNDCAMTGAQAENSLPAMGLNPDILRPVVEELVAAGEVSVAEDGTLRPSPALCDAGAAVLIEEALRGMEACRAPLAGLSEVVEAMGTPVAEFDAALGELAGSGRVVPAGAEVVLADCPAGVELQRYEAARIRALGAPYFRGVIALWMNGNGCRIAAEGRDAAEDSILAEVAGRLGLAAPLAAETASAIRREIEAVLDNPGSAYEIDAATGDIVPLYCTP